MQRMSWQIKAMILYHILRINRQKAETEISLIDIQHFLENAKKLKCKLKKILHGQSQDRYNELLEMLWFNLKYNFYNSRPKARTSLILKYLNCGHI